MRHAGIEVILVEHGAEFRGRCIEQLLVMVENARHRRRTAVAVQIDRADQKLGDFSRPRQRRQRHGAWIGCLLVGHGQGPFG